MIVYCEEMIENLKLIAFDADDTLWDNEPYFQQVGQEMCQILVPYADADTVLDSLYQTEMGNMADYGYGAVAFTLSLVENAVKVSQGKVKGEEILRIIRAGQRLMHLNAKPLEGVEETLAQLKATDKYRMVLFTKGELLTQENKLHRSGLESYFDKVVIVSNKDENAFRKLCLDFGIAPSELLMVGNSLKSDIKPALDIGAYGVYIPYHTNWKHEVMDEFEHDKMLRISKFCELLSLLI